MQKYVYKLLEKILSNEVKNISKLMSVMLILCSHKTYFVNFLKRFTLVSLVIYFDF